MDRKEKEYLFRRRIVSIKNQPRIYVIPISEKEKPPETAIPPGEVAREKGFLSFFADRLEKLLFSERERKEGKQMEGEEEGIAAIDRILESSLEAVHEKLEGTPFVPGEEKKVLEEERVKHERFIEERNMAQEVLFEETVQFHRRFVTGLSREDLWSLHDFMTKEANHEASCASETPLHEHVECNVISFFRTKAEDHAWQQLEEYIARFDMPFPISSTLEDPDKPDRNLEVRAERKGAARADFVGMPPDQLAELILGNVPVWVYSYPAQNSYLWRLTVFQAVAAALAANALMKSLALWERNSAVILKNVEQAFTPRIMALRKQGEAATDLSEVHAVSVALERVSSEEIPHHIWEHIAPMLKAG